MIAVGFTGTRNGMTPIQAINTTVLDRAVTEAIECWRVVHWSQHPAHIYHTRLREALRRGCPVRERFAAFVRARYREIVVTEGTQ